MKRTPEENAGARGRINPCSGTVQDQRIDNGPAADDVCRTTTCDTRPIDLHEGEICSASIGRRAARESVQNGSVNSKDGSSRRQVRALTPSGELRSWRSYPQSISRSE